MPGRWSDATDGVKEWQVLLRFDGESEVLRYASAEPRWRPSEEEWAEIKRKSTAHDAEVAIVGIGPTSQTASSATITEGNGRRCGMQALTFGVTVGVLARWLRRP